MRLHRSAGAVAVLFLLACQPAATPSLDLDETAMAALTATDDTVMTAMEGLDVPTYMALLADDVTWMVDGAASLHGKAAINAFWSQFTSIDGFTWSNRAIRGSGDLAYCTVDYQGRFWTGPDEPSLYIGKLLTVYRRQPDGRWLIETAIWNRSSGS